VTTNNTISSRKAKLSSLQTQIAQEQAAAERLGGYTQFAQLASTRAQTVRAIAGTRFGWYSAMSDLSKVIPANTSLQSLVGTVVPGANAGGGSGAAASSALRGAGQGPAFELTGCTKSQDAVASLISQLRVIHGVTRVTLGQDQKSDSAQSIGAASGSSAPRRGCPTNYPIFDIVVFFQPVPGAGANGPTSLSVSAAGTGAKR
jgi:Tfp pilus assembly protein PilN